MQTGTSRVRRIMQTGIGLFFIAAGLNHFLDPGFYLPLIPPVFPFPEFINMASGILEITGGIGYLFSRYRKKAGYMLVFLLILFIPSHVYFIQEGSCIENALCVPEWVGWVRLIVIHPLIIWGVLHFSYTPESGNE